MPTTASARERGMPPASTSATASATRSPWRWASACCSRATTSPGPTSRPHADRLCPRLEGRRPEQRPPGQGPEGGRLHAPVRGGGLRRPLGAPGVAPDARPVRNGDTVVVWKLDRLARSLKDVLHVMEKIGKAGAGFCSLTEAIDTTTPAGRVMMQMVGCFAEFE